MVLNSDNISKGDYNFFSAAYFFGFGDDNYSSDSVRIVKLFYILISLILNILIIISIIKKKNRKFSIALLLTGNILIINFIHSFSYSFEWVLKDSDHFLKLFKDDTNQSYYEVGGLLVGNMDDNAACITQGFFLVFSSLSQDILINIFFFVINRPKIPSKRRIRLYLFIGYCFPLIICLIFLKFKEFGINDKFCYIKKFLFENQEYSYNGIFPIIVMFIYALRLLNLIISIYLLVQIFKYVKANKLKKIYILKSSSILIIQIITILIGFLYRFISAINEEVGREITNTFLYINTLDGILFPLAYSLSNGIFQNLFCEGKRNSAETITTDEDEETIRNNETNQIQNTVSRVTTEKTFAMVDIKDDNNFDLSYN